MMHLHNCRFLFLRYFTHVLMRSAPLVVLLIVCFYINTSLINVSFISCETIGQLLQLLNEVVKIVRLYSDLVGYLPLTD